MSNAQWATNQAMDCNPMSKLWKNYFSNASLCVQLSKFMKVVELVEVQIMGFVKDEKTFSTLTSMETRLCNQLYEHLDLVVCMFAQPFYIVGTFPYDNGLMRR
jgi:hypothetical protein